jgi:HlyD family secretion protein
MTRTLVPRDAIAFQSDLDEVLAERPPRSLRTTSLLLAGFLVTIVGIAAFVKIDVLVTGQGQLKADTPTILLQPMERSIIRDLFVRAGDHVVRGEVVATLDATFTQADLNSYSKRARELTARMARLEAELSPAPPISLAVGDEEQSMQARLYEQRRQEFLERLASYDQAMARDNVALSGNRTAATALAKELAIATDVAEMRSALLQSEAGSRLQFLAAETNRIQADKDYAAARDQITELSHAIDAARADRAAFIAQWQRTDLEDLIEARAERSRVQGEISKATRLHDLVRLQSPCDGIVLDVAARAAGSVLHEAEALVTILPAGSAMIAEVSVPSADIGNLAEGQNVLLKVDAFPYQRHGMVHGVVRSIGEESFAQPQAAAAVHRVQIVLTRQDLAFMPKGAALFPGMTVTAEVNVGARNVLAYFLYPITNGFRESLREP